MTAWHSLQPGADLDPDVSHALRTSLEDILGWPRQSKHQLDKVFRKYPQEAEALVDVFRSMSTGDPTGVSGWTGNRQWKRATQSSRTASPLFCDENGQLILAGKNQHSHGFLTIGTLEVGLNALEGRRFLCRRLQNCLTVEQYTPLLQWVENPVELVPASVRDESGVSAVRNVQEMAGDSALGCAFYWIDAIFEGIFDHLVRKWRDDHGANDSLATPPATLTSIAEEANCRVKILIRMAAQKGCDIVKDDSLTLRFAAAVSANRAMDELWSRCALELKALNNAERLLKLLCEVGITHIPQEFLDDPPAAELDAALTAWLTAYLGPKGKLSAVAQGPRPMTFTQIRAAVKQSATLQEGYVLKQCGVERSAYAERQYGGSDVRFLFLVAVLAAYGFKSRVSNEFTGSNNSTKAVFAPQRNHDDSPLAMSVHSTTLIERMVALIHRSATQHWEFDIQALRANAEAKVHRLERQAGLQEYAVNGRAAPEIFGIYNFLHMVRNGSPRL